MLYSEAGERVVIPTGRSAGAAKGNEPGTRFDGSAGSLWSTPPDPAPWRDQLSGLTDCFRSALTQYGQVHVFEFDAAVARVSELSQDPGNDVKLKLYALYKQATSGDVPGNGPASLNPVGRAKYDAWAVCPACRPRMRRLSTSVWSIPVVRWDAAAYDGDHFVTDCRGGSRC